MSGTFFDLGGNAEDYLEHGPECTTRCRELAVHPEPDRARPIQFECPFCKAPAGVACRTLTGIPLKVWGRFHPSRMEVAA